MNRHVQKLFVVVVGLMLMTVTLAMVVSATGKSGNGNRISPQAVGMAASPSASPEASPVASPQASPVALAPTAVAVAIRGFQFDPPVAEVAIGGTVTWTNDDFMAHDVMSTPDGSTLRSPTLGTGQTFSFTFKDAGSYDYFCSIHPYMVGKVVVVEP